jgi:hypothetical protein
MPKLCNVEGCSKRAKWKSDRTVPVVCLCDEHSQGLKDLSFVKIVNCPCKTCISENERDVKEASFGPIIKGKRKRWYCKTHAPRSKSIKKKIVKERRCVFSDCFITANFMDGNSNKVQFCKKHIPRIFNNS